MDRHQSFVPGRTEKKKKRMGSGQRRNGGKPVSLATVLRSLAGNPRILRVKPSLSLFLLRYMRKFRIKKTGGNLVIHSHLPPLTSAAYRRFVNDHLLGGITGPSHAQIGITPDCPQNCLYCYNRNRTGTAMSTEQILQTIKALQRMGVFWLGFTGGEPLLQPDLLRITEAAAGECAVKLFTTGCTLTPQTAVDLKHAGLFSVSVSLDHRDAEVHDNIRRYPGAHSAALRAIELFRKADLHIGVSAVLAGDLLQKDPLESFLLFLEGLGVDEAWLSESKPSVISTPHPVEVIDEKRRQFLNELQDRWNRRSGMSVNYLGHFEGKEHFGCNAGVKMVYVDAFGEVSPCVFAPMSFGNIRDGKIEDIYDRMSQCFTHASDCFVNRNHKLLSRYATDKGFLEPEQSLRMMEEVEFTPPSRFFQLYLE